VIPATHARPRFLAPGDRLGKHDLIRQIAVGGMAELYLARSAGIEGFEKLVVVKRILPQYASNQSFVSMFLNEARLAATLHHPNVAQVYDIGQDQGDYFFSMEYVHGEDLGRIVATAIETGVPISLDIALTLLAGLCAGLHYAHEKASPDGKPLNVVHRDVSPSNVLVSYDGAVKLVDFGIARMANGPSAQQGLKGKVCYMSPEACRGNVPLDRRNDIFSVGTILYELTTGQLPFTDETEFGVMSQIVQRDAAPPSTIVPGYAPALEAIVMRALARDPDQRYPTALALQSDLEDFAHESRLRISNLVVARLMGTLFPERIEEWQHALAQGAFFIEQHVVRTLIESGKTPAHPIVAATSTTTDEPPTVAATPSALESRPTVPVSVPRVPTPPPVAVSRAPTPPSAVPVAPAMVTPPPNTGRAQTPGPHTPLPSALPLPPVISPTAIADLAEPMTIPRPIVAEPTERVRALPARPHPEVTQIISAARTSKRGLVITLAALLACVAAALTYVVLIESEDAAPRAQLSAPAQAAPAPAKAVAPAPAPAPDPAPAPPEPAAAPDPEPQPAAAAPEPADTDPEDKTVKKPTATKRPPVRRPRPKKPATTSEPKDSWQPDSPFMPVRPDKPH